MNETHVSLRGNLASDPVMRTSKHGQDYCTFRLATRARRFDPLTGAFVDGQASFYSVRCWRALGQHAVVSLRKGMPVVVTGRLRISEWEAEDGRRTSADLDADGVGPDLTWGTASWKKAEPARAAAPQPREASDDDPAGPDDAAVERVLQQAAEVDAEELAEQERLAREQDYASAV